MKSKLTFCLVLVLSGLVIGGCLTSANSQNQSPATTQNQFIYSTNAGGTTATITRYKGSSSAVTIPGTIDGVRVTSIGARAFWANPRVTSVIIPDGVTNIGNGAFSAVDSHSSLSNVVIGNGVIAIGPGAFHFCDKLTSIRIPRNVTSIGTFAFGGCFRLKQILVDPNNAAYTSVDGVLFNKNQTELVQYPPGKARDYTIPKTVTNIADYALWNCPRLTSIVIPEGVTTIKKDAFAACHSLTNIIIPASVTNVDLWAFDSCISLEGVYFRGNAPGHPQYHGYKGVDMYRIFDGDDVAVVYYLPGATGWGRTFNGRPTALWTFSVPTNLALIDEIHNAAKTGDLAKVEALLKSNPELASRKDPNASGYKLPQLEFQSIQMIDRENGWAKTADRVLIGNRWTFPKEQILRTTDGGKSWRSVLSSGSEQSLGTCFYDSKTAWVASAVQDDTNLTVFRTDDGGRSWTSVQVPQTQPIWVLSLSFADTRHGWLMLIPDHGMNSSPGYLYGTDDGGAKWQLVNTTQRPEPYWDPEGKQPGFANRHPYLISGGSIVFRNASVGWEIGSLTTTTRNFLFNTQDGGTHWQLQPLPSPGFPKGVRRGWIEPIGLPKFFPPNRQDGILPAQFVPGYSWTFSDYWATIIYSSHDGGLTWQPTTPVKFDCVWDFISARQGWIWSPRPRDTDSTAPVTGTLYRTNDGGQSWKPIRPVKGLDEYLTHGQNIVQLEFVDAKSGWAIARDQHNLTQLLRTTDGGAAWKVIQTRIQQ